MVFDESAMYDTSFSFKFLTECKERRTDEMPEKNFPLNKGCPKQFPNGGEGLFSKEERDMGKDQWMRKSIINKDQKYRYDCKVLDIMLV